MYILLNRFSKKKFAYSKIEQQEITTTPEYLANEKKDDRLFLKIILLLCAIMFVGMLTIILLFHFAAIKFNVKKFISEFELLGYQGEELIILIGFLVFMIGSSFSHISLYAVFVFTFYIGVVFSGIQFESFYDTLKQVKKINKYEIKTIFSRIRLAITLTVNLVVIYLTATFVIFKDINNTNNLKAVVLYALSFLVFFKLIEFISGLKLSFSQNNQKNLSIKKTFA
ncbi:MAG: hypothetical protein NOI47_000218 [Candidatus Phytoplasma pruni]|nr:hypothetical protein [Candidatus Phytoplasma pruni]